MAEDRGAAEGGGGGEGSHELGEEQISEGVAINIILNQENAYQPIARSERKVNAYPWDVTNLAAVDGLTRDLKSQTTFL